MSVLYLHYISILLLMCLIIQKLWWTVTGKMKSLKGKEKSAVLEHLYINTLLIAFNITLIYSESMGYLIVSNPLSRKVAESLLVVINMFLIAHIVHNDRS